MLLNLKNYIKKNAAVICVFLSVVFLFIGCEITHPYYFLQDECLFRIQQFLLNGF